MEPFAILLLLFTKAMINGQNCNGFGDLCQSCTQFRCEYCAHGYIDSRGICIFLPLNKRMIDNCFFYQNPSSCLQCSYGYYPGVDGQCIKMNNSCAIGTNSSCAFYFDSLSRFGKPVMGNCLTQDCRYCTRFRNDEMCYFCSSGYVLTKNEGKSVCQKSFGKLIGCAQTESPFYCSACDFGFVRKGLYCSRELRSIDEFLHNRSFLTQKTIFVVFLLAVF